MRVAEAATIGQLVLWLTDRYPRFEQALDSQTLAFAIDGNIYRDDWGISIPEGAEVFLIPRVQGG